MAFVLQYLPLIPPNLCRFNDIWEFLVPREKRQAPFEMIDRFVEMVHIQTGLPERSLLLSCVRCHDLNLEFCDLIRGRHHFAAQFGSKILVLRVPVEYKSFR